MSKVLFKVRDFEVKEGSIYTITPKPDSEAPEGLVNLGTTKIPSMSVANEVACRWVFTNRSSGTGVFDTGLTSSSPCYAGMDKTQVLERIKLIEENIIIPYEEKHSEGILHHANAEFWDSFRVRLNEGRILSSDNVDDRLDLLIALIGFSLTPKEHIGNPSYRGSQFCVEDSTKVQDFKNELSSSKIEAIGYYTILKKENKSKLKNLLRYVGLIGFDNEVDVDTLDSVILDWFESSEQNPKKFINAYELSSKRATQNILDYYGMLGELTLKGVVPRVDGVYRYKSIDLGADLKVASKFLNGTSKKVKELVVELLEIHRKE